MTFNRAAFAALSLVAIPLASSCAAVPVEPAQGSAANKGLASTKWTLVAFQSMDDSQGTTRPEAGKTYTLDFNADGTLAVQLDCNRGRGTWSPGFENATRGTLTIGPIASTRMACPPPSLGDKLGMWLSDVRSYTLRDGHLFLALKMDGGIIEFAPR